jgi:hypothetical protein
LIVDSDRAFPRESAVWAYWLTRCEGFTVRSGSRVLGVVESIGGSGTLGQAETLVVRSRYRQRVLDAGEVTAVVPGRQLLISVREPAPPRLRPAAATTAGTLSHAVAAVAALLARVVAYLAPRVAVAARVGGITAGRLGLAFARTIRREVLPLATAFLAHVVDEVERLTMLDGQPQPDGVAGQPPQRQAAERRERRNRARELREQARDEEEQLRVAEVAERALP